MAYLLIWHKVKDYTAWKSNFDNAAEMRKAGGEKSYQILHPDDDPNNLVLLFEWDNLDNARNYVAAPELKEAMQQAGVVEEPEIYFLEEVARGSV